jgi:hypothetical protein
MRRSLSSELKRDVDQLISLAIATQMLGPETFASTSVGGDALVSLGYPNIDPEPLPQDELQKLANMLNWLSGAKGYQIDFPAPR